MIAGYDEKDGNSVATEKIDYPEALGEGNVKGYESILSNDFGMEIDPKIQDGIEKAAEAFENLGANRKHTVSPSAVWIACPFGDCSGRV